MSCIISQMSAVENTRTASLGITYMSYHILGRKHDYSLVLGFQNSYNFKFIPP